MPLRVGPKGRKRSERKTRGARRKKVTHIEAGRKGRERSSKSAYRLISKGETTEETTELTHRNGWSFSSRVALPRLLFLNLWRGFSSPFPTAAPPRSRGNHRDAIAFSTLADFLERRFIRSRSPNGCLDSATIGSIGDKSSSQLFEAVANRATPRSWPWLSYDSSRKTAAEILRRHRV